MFLGTITWYCGTDSLGRNKWCGEEAKYFAYGMDRCLTHARELSPCMWKANQNDNGVCTIRHHDPYYARIYGFLCRNPQREIEK